MLYTAADASPKDWIDVQSFVVVLAATCVLAAALFLRYLPTRSGACQQQT